MMRTDVEARFWAKVQKGPGCWNWTACRLRGQWGVRYGLAYDGEKSRLAHRLAYEIAYGSIPVGMLVLHRCDNPACVRPDHLYLGTQADNERDAVERGRKAHGEGHGMHHLTEAQVLEIRRKYAAGLATQMELEKEYGIDQTQISNIVRRKQWAWLNP